jgi:hypothetical protein
MVKCQTIKLEFTPNLSKSFEICTKIYGSHIECAGKAAGKIGNDYFSAKYRFNIDARTQKISSIHFTDVTHIGKTDTPQFGCGRYSYYYDINSSDNSSCYSNIIDDSFEQQVYNALYHIFSTGTVTQSGPTLTITLTNTNTINYLVLHIKVGAHSYGNSSSVYNENSISDAIGKSCSNSCDKSSKSCGKSSSHKKSCSSSSSSSHKKSCSSSSSSSSSSTGSITTSSKTSSSSLFTSRSSKSKKSHKKHKKSPMQNMLKLIAWSAIISFIIYIFKTKINGGR